MNLGQILDFLLGIGKKYSEPVDFSVTVLVPAYNEEASIAATITSLKNQSYPIERILVIDDCSTDNTKQIALYQGAEVVTTNKQTGTKARAQNYVLPLVTTDVVIPIDADTCLASDAIEKMLPPLQDETIASVCGFVLSQKVETLWERARYIQFLWGFPVTKAAQGNLGVVTVSSGCFSAYRTELLKQLGGFPTRTVVEDMDLTWTQLEQGYKTVMAMGAKCYTLNPSTGTVYEDQLDRWYRGYFQVIALHKKNLLRNWRHAFFVVWSLVESLLYPLLSIPILITLLLTLPKSLMSIVPSLILSGVSIVIASVLLQAIKERQFLLALTSLPCYFLVCPVNVYLLWRSFVLEWVLGRKRVAWTTTH